MQKMKLYSRIECPLCEFAAQMLMENGIEFTEQDIDDHPALIQAYHVRIPVLSNGRDELNWPFTAEQAQELADG